MGIIEHTYFRAVITESVSGSVPVNRLPDSASDLHREKTMGCATRHSWPRQLLGVDPNGHLRYVFQCAPVRRAISKRSRQLITSE